MKWTTVATALYALPLALGEVLQAEVVARGNHHNHGNGNGNRNHGVAANKKQTTGGEAHVVVVLWVNVGGGAATQKMADPVTVVLNAADPAATAPAATHTVRPRIHFLLDLILTRTGGCWRRRRPHLHPGQYFSPSRRLSSLRLPLAKPHRHTIHLRFSLQEAC